MVNITVLNSITDIIKKNKSQMLHAQVDSATSIVDCVAGGIVGTHDIVLGAEPTREQCCHKEIRTRDYEIYSHLHENH